MRTITIYSLVCALLLISPAFGNDKKPIKDPSTLEPSKTPPANQKPEKRSPATPGNNSTATNINVQIGLKEREIIQNYISEYTKPSKGKKGKNLPPGLAKKAARGRDLPPGWQKKCVPGEIMPESVYKQCHQLPSEIVVKLPMPPPGTILVGIEGKIIRLSKAKREILDVFDPRP